MGQFAERRQHPIEQDDERSEALQYNFWEALGVCLRSVVMVLQWEKSNVGPSQTFSFRGTGID